MNILGRKIKTEFILFLQAAWYNFVYVTLIFDSNVNISNLIS